MIKSGDSWMALLATLLFMGSLLGFATALPGFSHLQHPPALLGAVGMPRALAFNLLALLCPGALLAIIAWRLRSGLPVAASYVDRTASGLLLLAALAFAAQGLLPLDLDDINDRGGRWHALAWMAWWLAFAAAQILFALGGHVYSSVGSRVAGLVLALLLALLAMRAIPWWPAGISQRGVYLLWFGWWCWATLRAVGHGQCGTSGKRREAGVAQPD